jgi:2-octaprenyl-6-methoxyphenol hydroxylase
MEHAPHADVLILGGGLVGSALAVALDRHGLSSIVIDPADPEVTLTAGFDGRASAVASASHRMLDAIGVGQALAGKGCAIRQIRVSDGLAPGKLDFIPAAQDAALGTMYENRLLRRALYEAAVAAPLADVRMRTRASEVVRDADGVRATLSSGETVRADLLVAAEGRNSRSRGGSTITPRSSAHSITSAATRTSRSKSSIPPARSRCCRCPTTRPAIAARSSGRSRAHRGRRC